MEDAEKSLVKPRIPTVQLGPKEAAQTCLSGEHLYSRDSSVHKTMAQPYREFTVPPERHARGKVKPERAHMWVQGVKCASQSRKVETKAPPGNTSRPPSPGEQRRNVKRDSP